MGLMTSNGQVILVAWWFVGGGIVLVQDELTFEYFAYIKNLGIQNGPISYPMDSTDVQKDMLNIASWGNKLPKESIKGFFPGLDMDETQSFKETNPGYLL